MLEQIYNDFTTKLLPTIQEGLVISKEYFTDLFGRYIKFLLITDIIWSIAYLAMIIFGSCANYWMIKYYNRSMGEDFSSDFSEFIFIPIFFIGLWVIVSMFSFSYSVENIIKDIYIPEVRVYEKLMESKNLINK